MSLFFQHIVTLYSSGEYSKIREELHNFEKTKNINLFPNCIYRELDYAESNTYRKIRDENVFPIRFLWLFELKEQVMMGVVMPLERSFYNPERLYETWLKIAADGDFRQELEKDDVLFDLENKAISMKRGWVLIGDTFIDDLIEIEGYYGEALMVIDEETETERPLFVEYKSEKRKKSSVNSSSTDFIRIVPAERFVGFPAPPYRPYAFYADAESLRGRTIADCYSLVKGLGLPPVKSWNTACSPYIWNQFDYDKGDYDTPLADIKVKIKHGIIFEDLPLKKLEKTKYVVLRVSRFDAVRDLDVFPATWRSLSYIVSDSERMGARQPGWDMDCVEYPSARIHALFKEVQSGSEKGLLALTESKESLGLTDLDRLSEKDEEFEYYCYLSRDSAFTNEIVDLFGISNRCWHGCGYLGTLGKPICRFFLLRNKMRPSIKVSVMSGKELFPYT